MRGMPRQSRIVLPHVPHHVTQRGNYGQPVFESEADYKKYCHWFKSYSEKYGLETYAYCLMTNHVHFIVVPKNENALARVFNTLHMMYSQHLNKRKGVTGHLWQGRFFSCVLDETHLYRAIRYVERNPIRARMARYAWDYTWSSASEHVGKSKGIIPLQASLEMKEEEWAEYLKEPDEEMVDEIRIKTQKGSIVGSEQFIKHIENRFNRPMARLSLGRPKKETAPFSGELIS